MRGVRLSWLLTVTILSFTFIYVSEARHEKQLPPAVVVGSVYCDTCFQEDFSRTSHFISGALVAVECGDSISRPSFRQEVKTDEHGEFEVKLPFLVGKHVKKIKGCSVKLISSSEPYCAVASTATSSSIHLKSRKAGTHIFSAGFFTFKPLKQPDLCSQKPSIQNSKKLNSVNSLIPNLEGATFTPPIANLPPTDPYQFPPLPQLPMLPPLPQLPPLPRLPGFPYFPPVPSKASQLSDLKAAHPDVFPPIPRIPFLPPPSILPPNPLLPPPSILPPNPLLPPPSILPPNPFQPPASILPPIFPSPPPSIFPPIFPSPSSPPLTLPPILPFPPITFPPIPGITPSPPPPPAFRIPLPPLPFQPTPGFPGIPPAASSSKKTFP